MSMRNTVNKVDMGHISDNATAEVSQITLKHDEISTELYTGHVFPAYELVPTADRHRGTLTGKPLRKQQFSQYCWKRCVIGTKSDYSQALNKEEWHEHSNMVT